MHIHIDKADWCVCVCIELGGDVSAEALIEGFMEETSSLGPGQLQEVQRDFQFSIPFKFLTGSQTTKFTGKLLDKPKSPFFLNPIALVHLSRVHKTKAPGGTPKEMSVSEVENWDTCPTQGDSGCFDSAVAM